LTFVAFDVLAYNGEPVIGWPYTRRRALLDRLALGGPAWCATPQPVDRNSPSHYREPEWFSERRRASNVAT
jgi:ATP-dependent DNA ligase